MSSSAVPSSYNEPTLLYACATANGSASVPRMNPQVPLPSPAEAMWRAYLGLSVSVLPAFSAMAFASIFLQPRLEMVWRDAGLVGSRAQWLMSLSNGFHDYLWFEIFALALLMVVLERRVRLWPRYRTPVIFSGSVLLNATVFSWLLMLATAALLAAPHLADHK